MAAARILAFAGSTRNGSVNQALLNAAVEQLKSSGADVTSISLADFPMPLFDQDWEAENGLPEKAVELKKLFAEHTALLIACPEYNSSLTPLLKNTIDWVTRPASKDEQPLSSFSGKTAGLLAASPGGFGGLRGLRHVREILSNIRVLVCPNQFALSQAHAAFDEDGKLKDEKQASMLSAFASEFLNVVTKQA